MLFALSCGVVASTLADDKPSFRSFLKRAVGSKEVKSEEPRIQKMVRQMMVDAHRMDEAGDVAGAIKLVRRVDKMVSVASRTTPIEWTPKDEQPQQYLKQLETRWQKIQAERIRTAQTNKPTPTKSAARRIVGIPQNAESTRPVRPTNPTSSVPKNVVRSEPKFVAPPFEESLKPEQGNLADKTTTPPFEPISPLDGGDWSPAERLENDTEDIPFGEVVASEEDEADQWNPIQPVQFESEETTPAEENKAATVDSNVSPASRTETNTQHDAAAPGIETLELISPLTAAERGPSILKLDVEPTKAVEPPVPVVTKPTIIVNSPTRATPWFRTAMIQFFSTILALCLVLIIFLLVRQFVFRRYGTKLGLVLQVERPGDELNEHALAYAPVDTVKFPVDERNDDAPKRGSAHDFQDMPIPLRVVSTYEDERLAEEVRREEQEQSMMKHIFQQNIELRDQLADLK
ncbi:MAG: hypothetical protein CMJ78_23995 [Planctomycetaceae bacterium]|nr:hypothetical protein [Planctomycetaceae bacterium]